MRWGLAKVVTPLTNAQQRGLWIWKLGVKGEGIKTLQAIKKINKMDRKRQ